jgi:hypothetical protein
MYLYQSVQPNLLSQDHFPEQNGERLATAKRGS